MKKFGAIRGIFVYKRYRLASADEGVKKGELVGMRGRVLF